MNGHAVIVHTGTQMEKINVKCAHKKEFLAQSQIRLNLKPINTNNPHNNSYLQRSKSLLPNRQAPNHLRSNSLLPNHQAPKSKINKFPVSYTHLTLPTKRIV